MSDTIYGGATNLFFNLALERFGCGVELNASYNIQLDTQYVQLNFVDGRVRAKWHEQPVHVLHFNGNGRHKHSQMRNHLVTGSDSPVGTENGKVQTHTSNILEQQYVFTTMRNMPAEKNFHYISGYETAHRRKLEMSPNSRSILRNLKHICIGLHVHTDPLQLHKTLHSLRENTKQAFDLLLLPDGPDDATKFALNRIRDLPLSGMTDPLGPPACFNRLANASSVVTLIALWSRCTA